MRKMACFLIPQIFRTSWEMPKILLLKSDLYYARYRVLSNWLCPLNAVSLWLCASIYSIRHLRASKLCVFQWSFDAQYMTSMYCTYITGCITPSRANVLTVRSANVLYEHLLLYSGLWLASDPPKHFAFYVPFPVYMEKQINNPW